MQPFRPAAKAGIVLAGVAVALAAGWIAILARQHLTAGADAQASAGMYAWGDLMLGVAVCGGLGVVPLALALHWLRPVPAFWRMLAFSGVLIAVTGPVLLALTFVVPPQSAWTMAAPLRVMAMPLFGGLWFTSGTSAPEKRERWILWGAALLEGAGFAATVLVKIVLPLAR